MQSALHKARLAYQPTLPSNIREIDNITIVDGAATEPYEDKEDIKALFPNTYGLPVAKISAGANADIHRPIRCGFILSGGPAAGGHNVVSGLFDGLKAGNPENQLFGFRGAAGGILRNDYIEITKEVIDQYRNMGGFDIVGSGRDKIETEEQFALAYKNVTALNLNVMVVVGGDDSNTNCAVLAEYFKAKGSDCIFVGVPKTVDGDLKNEWIETSFGFDSCCRTYAELVGNIQRDAISSRKYWHFMKVMGRAASNIGLEVALQSQPTYCFIGEEIEAKNITIEQLGVELADIVIARHNAGKNYGVVIVPEGVIEFIPEMRVLISELNDLMGLKKAEFEKLETVEEKREFVLKNISEKAQKTFNSVPANIQGQILLDRDPHGNVNVSAIETETFVSSVVKNEIKKRGVKCPLSCVHHFCGYEGRCCYPTNFDANYCYALGYTAFVLGALKKTGRIATVSNLKAPVSEWVCGGVPLTVMMNMEQRAGHKKPVIKKALVDLNGKPFKYFAERREQWAKDDCFVFPGAIQYYGPDEICNQTTKTLNLEQN